MVQESYPLALYQCRACGHVQLLDVVDPSVLFNHYVYVSGTNPSFVAHFVQYAKDMMALLRLQPGDRVLDVGSNDGVGLRPYKEAGMAVLGVDPAEGIARNATASGIPTERDFFTHSLSRRLRNLHGEFRLVTANNVFAHSDDLADMAMGVKHLLAADGLFVFEVAYLVDMLEKATFDLCYSEHTSMHHVAPLVGFFRRHGLELVRVQHVSTHGGSIRCFVQHENGPLEPDGSVEQFVKREEALGVGTQAPFRGFFQEIRAAKADAMKWLREQKAAGRTVAGLGAPAKATTLMHYFGMDRSVVDFIMDPNPLKQGKYSPGYHVPIVGEERMKSDPPDVCILFAWNLADNIIPKHEDYLRNGGIIMVPLPRLRVVSWTETPTASAPGGGAGCLVAQRLG